ncbi:MAG TPA: PP2C family protein-serine/threonine phosphatase [Thermoanaerobaculia bacterium]|nr:PP2C family protein-serine/threonine phosphatase [Thermoanaerobaculia bacterium]
MRAPSIDDLVLLPEPLALQRHYDAKNYRTFRWLWALTALVSVIGIIAAAKGGMPLRLVLFVLGLVGSVALFGMRQSPLFERHFRQILLSYLAFQLVLIKLAPSMDDGFALFAMLMLFFRFRVTEFLILFGASWITAILPPGWVGLAEAGAPRSEDFAELSVMHGIFLGLAVLLTHFERRRFLGGWRREHGRSRERLRMREEIEYARKIQLSMLPQAPPEAGWIELAGASLPATEVGGDYYDYFALSPSRLALVVGDVSGHGLACGLLLSGVRSCLYLMEEDLATPALALQRLNRMVRRTTDRRTYVTLLCALVDREAGTLTVASAGHPPVVCFDPRSRTLQEMGQGAPPLGTFLKAQYQEESRPIARGDLLVFYTDGLTEARNSQGVEYGVERLQKVISHTWDAPVREIRDAVLSDLSRFKGDGEQADDITVVIARLK